MPCPPFRGARRYATGLLAGLALLVAGAASAQSPRLSSIRFEGNTVTREYVMQRELALAVGDLATPEALERSRQALLDLGLFREVALRLQPADGGAAELVVVVTEKRYVLPLPRLDGSSDDDLSFGLQLRWANVGGRNHRLNLYVEDGDFDSDRDREGEQRASLSYFAPLVWQDRYNAWVALSRTDRQLTAELGGYEERQDRLEFGIERDERRSRPRRGWLHGLGMAIERQQNLGPTAPEDDGDTYALVAHSAFEDRRFRVYSETGTRLNLRLEAADESLGSDFGYRRLDAHWFHSRPFGERDHQTLHFIARGGYFSGGARRRNTYSLGGSGELRGFDVDAFEGQRYWYTAVEALRPLKWDWLRGFVFVEAGAAGGNLQFRHDSSPRGSIGAGVRMRLTWFVDVEIEAGVAWPIGSGGDGLRFFAGGN